MTARACDDAGVKLGVIRIRPLLGGGGDTGPKMFWRKRHSGDQRRTSSRKNFALSLLTITHHLRSQSHSVRKETFRTLIQVHRQPCVCSILESSLFLLLRCFIINIAVSALETCAVPPRRIDLKRARRTLCPERFRIVDVSGGPSGRKSQTGVYIAISRNQNP